MADTHIVNQLKFKISSLESQLADKQKTLEEYQTIEAQADNKIKALNKMNADKIKNLLNSIQVLKKEKAAIEGLSKQHKRSKLIEQLNKEIGDQDIVIEVLRKYVYDKEGKEKGRQICDEVIVKALTKGPDRIRPLSREELRMQIDRLKTINLNLEGKLKIGIGKAVRANQNGEVEDDLSEVSSVSQQSFVNQNDQILKKLRQFQFENENLKLQVNAKLKIIEKLKIDLKQTQKLRTQVQILRNEGEVAQKKVSTYEKLMKQSKESTNTKIIELYEREIKVEELEMVSKENRQKLKQAQQAHNVVLEQIKLEKQKLEAEIEGLKQQNEQVMLDNISQKKRMDELKKMLKDLDELNSKQKQDMKSRMISFENELERLVVDNKKYSEAYRNAESTLFEQRARWVEKEAQLLEEVKNIRQNKANSELLNKYVDDIAALNRENKQLKQLLEGGKGNTSGSDKILLTRIATYEQKIKFLEGKGKVSDDQRFNELYKEYNELLQKYDQLLKQVQEGNFKTTANKKNQRKEYINITQKQKSEYQLMSSGVSRLELEDISSDLLDNFDSSLEYEFIINENGERVKMPKLTDADKQLLKLMTSDLWNFVTDDKIDRNLQKAVEFMSEDEDLHINYKQMTKLKNLSNPRGKKVLMYEQQVDMLGQINDSISVTSAMDKQLNKFDSDVNIEFKRLPKGSKIKEMNAYNLQDVSVSVDGESDVSSVKLGESGLVKKKKKAEEKASRISIKKQSDSMQNDSDFGKSSIGSDLLDSDVSSAGVRESQLAMLNSDVELDFKKKK